MADIDAIEDASPSQGSSSSSVSLSYKTPDPIKICGVGHLTM